MTFELDELDVGPIPEWMKEVKEIFRDSKERKLPESRGEYDYVIELI